MGHSMVWITALMTLVSVNLVSTIFYWPSYQHDALTASLYACSYRIIMAAATGTILMACALGHGGTLHILVPKHSAGGPTLNIYTSTDSTGSIF
jgi:hypothetical protein